MPLKQSLASFALYSLDQKYISSFSACCLTAKGERAGEGGGQKQKKNAFDFIAILVEARHCAYHIKLRAFTPIVVQAIKVRDCGDRHVARSCNNFASIMFVHSTHRTRHSTELSTFCLQTCRMTPTPRCCKLTFWRNCLSTVVGTLNLESVRRFVLDWNVLLVVSFDKAYRWW